MKVRMYLDVYKGWDPKYATAFTSLSYDPSPGSTRLFFDVDVPDHIVKYEQGQQTTANPAQPITGETDER